MARHRWLDPLAAQIGMGWAGGVVGIDLVRPGSPSLRLGQHRGTPVCGYRGCCRPAGSLGSPQREPPQLPTRRGARDGQLCWSATSVGGGRRAPKEDAGQRTAARAIRLPGKRSPRSMDEMRQGRRVHTLLIEDLVAERVADLHRQGDRARARLAIGRGSGARQAATRLQGVVGFWLVGVGLRLALAAAGPGSPRDGADLGSSSSLRGSRSHGRSGGGSR